MGSAMHYLAVGLGIFFVVAGVVKVVPIQPVHGEMVTGFKQFAPVFPLKIIGIHPEAGMYRCVVGVTEIILGALLSFGRHDWRYLSCISLLVIMIGALQTLIAIGAPVNKMFPALICGGLLLLLLFRGFRGKSHLD